MVESVKGIAAPVSGINNPTLGKVLEAVVAASREVSRSVRAGPLLPEPASPGVRNVHGELVHPLDIVGTERFVEAFAASKVVAGLVCEELDEPKFFEVTNPASSFMCVLDPIDGSSNADIAITIGSIVGVFPTPSQTALEGETPFLRSGSELIAAAYVLYGSSTVLVLATPGLVQEFTLNEESVQFELTRPSIQIPESCQYYSVNQGYENRWNPPVRRAVGVASKNRSLRYVGSLVSDFHRNLIRGGIFLYPDDSQNPDGKIRVLYEAAVFAYIAAQAGGASSTGTVPVLDLIPSSVHQRTPLYIGNATVVDEINEALWS